MTDTLIPAQNSVEPIIAITLPLAEAISFASSVTVDSVPGERLRQAAEAYKHMRSLDQSANIPSEPPRKI